MNAETRQQLDAYYEKAGSWADDQLVSVRRSRKTAWIVALIAACIALIEAVALALLMPLKTVVPYTLMVDRQTGHVQTLKPLEADTITPDVALTQSFLVQYVLAREGFSFSSVQSEYRKVMLWSAQGAKTSYSTLMAATNPTSPIVRIPRSNSIEAKVRSVSDLSKGSALVRFETSEKDKSGAGRPTQSWVAIINYRFSNGPMPIEERYTNPLGFQVTQYTRNPEALSTPVEDPQNMTGSSVNPQAISVANPNAGNVTATPTTSMGNGGTRP